MINPGTMEVEEAIKDSKNSTTAKIIVIACVFVSCLAVLSTFAMFT